MPVVPIERSVGNCRAPQQFKTLPPPAATLAPDPPPGLLAAAAPRQRTPALPRRRHAPAGPGRRRAGPRGRRAERGGGHWGLWAFAPRAAAAARVSVRCSARFNFLTYCSAALSAGRPFLSAWARSSQRSVFMAGRLFHGSLPPCVLRGPPAFLFHKLSYLRTSSLIFSPCLVPPKLRAQCMMYCF